MKFTITRQNLHNGLAAVSASIPSKTTLPVLSNILLETEEDIEVIGEATNGRKRTVSG